MEQAAGVALAMIGERLLYTLLQDHFASIEATDDESDDSDQ